MWNTHKYLTQLLVKKKKKRKSTLPNGSCTVITIKMVEKFFSIFYYSFFFTVGSVEIFLWLLRL